MSSIYRKGRDGYYYYQTYVYNPDTGKKNKRIFHSLGTKDQEEAKMAQFKLDIEHEKQKAKTAHKRSLINLIPIRKFVAIFACTVIIIFFFKNIFKSESHKHSNITDPVKESIQIDEDMMKIIEHSEKVNIAFQPVQNTTQIDVSAQPTIPKHTIVRIERFSDAFDQGKIYVTVDQSSSKESMRLLCEKLRKDYNEFSNILICLYADNTAGNDLAMGIKSKHSIKEQNRVWLVMYSYNIVEGEYFDDNPGRYLGVY